MASINDKATVDLLIANDGIYPGDEDYPVVKITQYNNAFDGRLTYGLQYKGDPDNSYAESPFIRNPVVLWEKGKEPEVKAPLQDAPTLETIQSWLEDDGGCEATDGCWVEVDGTCPHGKKSWMLVLGLSG